MTLPRRCAWLLFLFLFWIALSGMTGIVSTVSTIILGETVSGVLPKYTPEALGAVFGQAMQLSAVLLPWWVWPRLRDFGWRRFSWTWTLLFILPYTLLHGGAAFLLPISPHHWSERACLVWLGLVTGVIEEVFFRGYMFHDRPEIHPRFVVLVSSLLFAWMHAINLTHDSLHAVIFQLIYAFVFGLGAGIVRLVTGSLAWCIVVHSTWDALSGTVIPTPGFWAFFLLVLIVSLPAAALVLWRHPKFRAPDAPSAHSEAHRPEAPSNLIKGAAVFLTYVTAWLAVFVPFELTHLNRGVAWMQKVLPATQTAEHLARSACLLGLGVLLPLGLICFYLAAAVRPLSPRGTSVGWIVSTIYHAVAAWLLVAVLHETLTMQHLPLPLWSVSVVAFLTSLFLVVSRLGRSTASGLPAKNTA